MDYKEIIEFAPIIVVVLLFMWQNNIFIKPEELEKKHREINSETDKKIKELTDDITQKYVEINAYREFQSRIYSELEKMTISIEELKDYIMKENK
jgi:hypothetical protein